MRRRFFFARSVSSAAAANDGATTHSRNVSATAALLAETFLECVVAPSFAAAALETLRAKKNLRLIATGTHDPNAVGLTYKRVSGGLVVQAADATGALEATNAK